MNGELLLAESLGGVAFGAVHPELGPIAGGRDGGEVLRKGAEADTEAGGKSPWVPTSNQCCRAFQRSSGTLRTGSFRS